MLELKNIKKDYLAGENTVHALKGINLTFGETGFVSILGHSGCGKTTLLNIVGGLDKYTEGDLIIDNKSTKNYSDKDWDAYRNKHIGFIFQSYNLIPHLTCLQNVSLSPTVGGESVSNSSKKAKEVLIQMGLEDQINKFPNQLSGGQQQRVAVARALINNPSIILADEPTGALDSENSEVLMGILKEISKDHLIIMVTHNNELAEKYSDRIISMSDGLIVNDTAAESGQNNEILKNNKEKSGFNLRTAIKLSSKTLLTKKGRTSLTAFASSIGIIGVGLVLALSTGFSNYVNKVERESSANMPIVINSSQTIYAKNEDYVNYEKFPKIDEIIPYDTSTSAQIVAQTRSNNITKEYLEYINNIDNTKYKNSIGSTLVNYAKLNRNLVSKTADGLYTGVDPDTSVSSASVASVIATISGLPRTILHEFYGTQDYISQTYDVLYGTYPKDEMINGDTFEIALVLDSYNRIESTTLRRMGLYSQNELDSMIENKEHIKFSDFVGKEYTFYLTDDLYEESEAFRAPASDRATTKQTISIKDGDGNLRDFEIDIPINSISQYREAYKAENLIDLYNGQYKLVDKDGNVKQKTAKAYHLKVTSIMRVKEDSLVDYMPASLCYTKAFGDFCYAHDEQSAIAQSQNHPLYSNIEVNNLQSLFNLFNTKNCFSLFAESGLIDENVIPSWMKELPNASQADMTAAFEGCAHWYSPFASEDENGKLIQNTTNVGYRNYVTNLSKLGINLDEVQYTNLQEFITTFSDLINAVQNNNTIKEAALIAKLDLMMKDPTLLPNMFAYLAVELSNYSRITSIIIFPKNLETKPLIKQYLDEYNAGKENSKQVVYSDYVGDFTESLYTIISIISIVLIAFSAISLFVSSIMSSVITYTSVVERTKEIGVYRAIGARKRDVGKLFMIENIIVGAIAGVIGVIFVYIASIPINTIIGNIYAEYHIGNICFLPPYVAVILVILAMFLGFLASIIPARVASNKDPVIALRTE